MAMKVFSVVERKEGEGIGAGNSEGREGVDVDGWDRGLMMMIQRQGYGGEGENGGEGGGDCRMGYCADEKDIWLSECLRSR